MHKTAATYQDLYQWKAMNPEISYFLFKHFITQYAVETISATAN